MSIECFLHSDKITHVPGTHVYITNANGVNDLNQLIQLGIKHVINVAPGAVIDEYPGINYTNLSISDDSSQNILQHFDEVFAKFDSVGLLGERIVINCQVGASRSASFVIGYLIRSGMSYDDGYKLLKSARPIVNPNQGFVEQLKKYEELLNLHKY